jgi:hypothetical protein
MPKLQKSILTSGRVTYELAEGWRIVIMVTIVTINSDRMDRVRGQEQHKHPSFLLKSIFIINNICYC